jgi:hypothetical protein
MSDIPVQNISVDVDTFQSLHLIAEKNNMEIQSLINMILKNYLYENIDSDTGISEKRKFKRKKTIIPALVYKPTRSKDTGKYLSTTVLDISIGGTKLAVPLEDDSRVEFSTHNSEFEIILHLSDNQDVSRFKCQLRHLEKDDKTQNIGVSFLECDQSSHAHLASYLSQ